MMISSLRTVGQMKPVLIMGWDLQTMVGSLWTVWQNGRFKVGQDLVVGIFLCHVNHYPRPGWEFNTHPSV